MNRSKCQFMKPEVVFLGRKVTAKGIMPTHSLTEAVREAPKPTNVSKLRAFLGMLNYYCKFLPEYSLRAITCLAEKRLHLKVGR